MDVVEYRGHVLRSSTINSLVASAASGRPLDPKTEVTDDDPVDWLVGLYDVTLGTDLASSVEHAFNMVLRTGDSKQLLHIARVSQVRDVCDPATLLTLPQAPRAHRNRDTTVAVGAAIAQAVARGYVPYDIELRGLASDRRFRGSATPAFVVADREWFIANATSVLTVDPQRASDRLRPCLSMLDEDAQRQLYDQLRTVSPDPAWLEAMAELLSQEPLSAADTTPWLGSDGQWYAFPDDLELLPGELTLRRMGEVREVDGASAEGFRLNEEQARAALAGRVDGLYERVRDALRDRFSLPMPDKLEEFTGASTETLLAGTPPAPGRSVEEFGQELGDRIKEHLSSEDFATKLRSFASAIRDGVQAAKDNLEDPPAEE